MGLYFVPIGPHYKDFDLRGATAGPWLGLVIGVTRYDDDGCSSAINQTVSNSESSTRYWSFFSQSWSLSTLSTVFLIKQRCFHFVIKVAMHMIFQASELLIVYLYSRFRVMVNCSIVAM